MSTRLAIVLIAVALAGSLAVGAIWQADGDGAPASRDIFPKVLNR